MIRDIAKMIDHAVLHPTATATDIRQGCELAAQWDIASICIQPYAVPEAVNQLKRTHVTVGTVIGFPQGSTFMETKMAEAEKACEEGAGELDMVINIGKTLDRNWAYISREIEEIREITTKAKALLKVIFETDFIREDSLKMELCHICSSIGVDYVKTSTGFGMTKTPEGQYSYKGATAHDVLLMKEYCTSGIKIKASGGIRTLSELLKFRDLGASRIGTSSTHAIMTEATAKFK